MAFLKETERSLRLYFFVAGTIATLLAVRALGDATSHPVAAPSGIVMLAIWFPLLARVVLGPAFVVAGITLKGALKSGAGWIKNLVKLAAAVLVVEVFAVTVVATNSIETSNNSAELLGQATGRALIPLLILWYLHASLWRLAADAQLRAVGTVAR
jgi:hypothetical protein